MRTHSKRAVPLPALLVAALAAAALLVLCAPRPAHAGGDGALNPEPGEYYTLYCANDLLEVWRSTPASLLLTTVSIADLLLLPEGGMQALPDSMSVERRTADTLAVLGSNGNAAPAAGEKFFYLNECIARNGSVPDLPGDPPPPTGEEIACRIGCQLCIPCFLGDPCVESPSLGDFDPFCYPDQFGGCPLLCLELCGGLPIPDELPPPPLSARGPRAKPPDPGSSGLELLYAVRGQILGPTLAGRRYRDLFYAHHGEILRLLVSHWGRWEEGYYLLVRFQRHLLALVEGRGAEVVISAEDVTAVEEFLDHLASPASTELAAALAAERANAQLAQFVGQTMEDARRVLIGPASCPDAPDPACATGFTKSSLLVDERKAGREKVVAKLGKGPALVQADFGDPTLAAPSDVSLCIYDAAGTLAGALGVARGGDSCGKKPCWKSLGGAAPGGTGFAYKDKAGLADGFRSISLKGGAAGKSSLAASAGNQAKKHQTRLPDGIAAGLATTASATVQLRTPGQCFGAELSQVVKQEPGLFQAK